MNKELLVVGVDPGITTGYAVLNLDGELIRLKSAKYLTLSTLISEVVDEGKVVVVGTDVRYSPKFVDKFCSKLNARLFSPKEDMKVGFKQRLTSQYKTRDDHQRDALAAALFAYGEVKDVIARVDAHLKREGKEHLSDQARLIVLQGMPIADAIPSLEEKEKIEVKVKKRIREKVKKSVRFAEHEEYLKRMNQELQRQVQQLNERLERVTGKMNKIVNQKIMSVLEIKNRKIDLLQQQVSEQQNEVQSLKKSLADIHSLIMTTENKVCAKKFKTLNIDEILSAVKKGDVILVDDPNSFSEKTFDFLRDKVDTILYKKKPGKYVSEKPFNWVNVENLGIVEREEFALVNKDTLEKEKKQANLLFKLVEEYQEERRGSL